MNTYSKGGKPHQGSHSSGYGQRREEAPGADISGLLPDIQLATPAAELFDTVAEAAAMEIAKNAGKRNKSTQLRKFYDEIVGWDQRIRELPEADRATVYGSQYLPLIRMLSAKAAYAESRELIDHNYMSLLRHGLKQLTPDNPATYHNFKLFMEAFMGFYKLHGPK